MEKNKTLMEIRNEMLSDIKHIGFLQGVHDIDFTYEYKHLYMIAKYRLPEVVVKNIVFAFIGIENFYYKVRNDIVIEKKELSKEDRLKLIQYLEQYNNDITEFKNDNTFSGISNFYFGFRDWIKGLSLNVNIKEYKDIYHHEFINFVKKEFNEDITFPEFIDSNLYREIKFIQKCYNDLIRIENGLSKICRVIESHIENKYGLNDVSVKLFPFDFNYPTLEAFSDNKSFLKLMEDYSLLVKDYK